MGTHRRPTHTETVDVTAGSAPPKVPAPDRRADEGDIVDIWGRDSFPASDPPANW